MTGVQTCALPIYKGEEVEIVSREEEKILRGTVVDICKTDKIEIKKRDIIHLTANQKRLSRFYPPSLNHTFYLTNPGDIFTTMSYNEAGEDKIRQLGKVNPCSVKITVTE